MNALLYARVSTDKQADKDLSIPAQLQAMRDYARQHGWTIAEEFVEPGASAKTAERPVLQRLLSRVRDADAKVNVVLVHKIDRLARNVYDHAAIKALLTANDVRLASVVENVDESVSGQLIENIMASLAQFYSSNLAEEVKKGMRQKVLKGGWPHKPPRGYVVVKNQDGKAQIEIHHREGPLMRRAFELYATGWYSMRALARRLAKEGLVASNGKPIPQAHVRRLLSNPFYIGRVRWQDIEAQGSHPPLVTDSLFAKVQAMTKQRFRDSGVKGSIVGFPLRGLAICAYCRGRMTAERHRRWSYYRCSRRSYRKEACASGYCNADKAHAALQRVCLQIRLGRETGEAIMRVAQAIIDERTAKANQRAGQLQTRTADLLNDEVRLAEAFTAEDISPKAFVATVSKIKGARAQLEHDLARPVPTAADLSTRVARTVQVASCLWDLYEQMNEPRRIELLRNVFKAVVLDRDGIAGFTLNPPFDKLAVPHGPKLRTTEEMAQAIVDAA